MSDVGEDNKNVSYTLVGLCTLNGIISEIILYISETLEEFRLGSQSYFIAVHIIYSSFYIFLCAYIILWLCSFD